MAPHVTVQQVSSEAVLYWRWDRHRPNHQAVSEVQLGGRAATKGLDGGRTAVEAQGKGSTFAHQCDTKEMTNTVQLTHMRSKSI